MNDQITRKAFIAELDKVRIPMLEASCTGIDEGGDEGFTGGAGCLLCCVSHGYLWEGCW